jgi:hypothetical protein
LGSALETRWVTEKVWVSSENSYVRKRFGVCPIRTKRRCESV